MKLQKIGILTSSINIWGGGQIYIEQLCLYLCRNNFDCLIYTAEPNNYQSAVHYIPIINTPLKRLWHTLAIARVMRRNGVSHLVLNDLSSAWLAPFFRIFGFRVISLLHIPLKLVGGKQKGHKWFFYYLIKWALRLGTHKILTVDMSNLQIAPWKSIFVGNFVPDWMFKPALEKKKYDICFVGRLSWEKNVPLLLKIIFIAKRDYGRSLKTLIIGGGIEEKKIRLLIKEYRLEDRVQLQGWCDRSQLPQIYSSSKCFAITSFHEGFATTLLESHACGVPAFTTNVGYCGQFVESFQDKTGFIFQEKDIEDKIFFKKLFELIDNSDTYKKKCIEKAKFFSEDKILGRIMHEINGVD